MDHTSTQYETVPCAFCKGLGTDPFNVMSPLSRCTACDGEGRCQVPVPHMPCAFCAGTGSFKTYRCPVCGGSGAVAAMEGPCVPCPDCEGRAFDASSGLPCLACRGRGIVQVAEAQAD